MIRFEILLPLFYNDGRPIEPEKFLAKDDDLVTTFGATSTDQVTVRGHWKYQSTAYSDQLIRVRVDVADTTTNQDAMRVLKEPLKLRFDQLDIWITAHRKKIGDADRCFGRSGTGSAAAFGGAKPVVRKRRRPGTDGREIGTAIDLSSPGPAKKANGENKAVKLPENGPRALFFYWRKRNV